VPATPYDDINVLLESLLSQFLHVLQQQLVGVYLYGSLTAGDFDHESSDIDLLVATRTDISKAEFEALDAVHRDFAIANPEWDNRIEVAYLSVTALQTFKTETSRIAVISPGEPFHMKDAGRDYLQNWYAVREIGKTLVGPLPTAVIAPITQDEFVHAVRVYVKWVGDKVGRSRKGQAYAILTMCRALHVHRLGMQASKRQAALWAQKELPEWSPLIQNALAWRAAWRDESVNHAATYPDTVRFVTFVRDQILA